MILITHSLMHSSYNNLKKKKLMLAPKLYSAQKNHIDKTFPNYFKPS